MNVRIGIWRKSLAVRIPRSMAKNLGLKDGSQLEITVLSGELILRPIRDGGQRQSLEEMLARITPDSIHAEHDLGQPVGLEHW